jgi:hypothetical protein
MGTWYQMGTLLESSDSHAVQINIELEFDVAKGDGSLVG